MIRYIVRFGHEYPNVTSASGSYDSQAEAEKRAWEVLGFYTIDDEVISFSQIIKIIDGLEEVVAEFEY